MHAIQSCCATLVYNRTFSTFSSYEWRILRAYVSKFWRERVMFHCIDLGTLCCTNDAHLCIALIYIFKETTDIYIYIERELTERDNFVNQDCTIFYWWQEFPGHANAFRNASDVHIRQVQRTMQLTPFSFLFDVDISLKCLMGMHGSWWS